MVTDTEKKSDQKGSSFRIYMRKKQQVKAIDDEDNNRSDVCVCSIGDRKKNHSDARVLREKKRKKKRMNE